MEGKDMGHLDDISDYYSDKVLRFGATAQGVDWNSEESQHTRFDQLCKIVRINREAFSINDLGCGYGALFAYLRDRISCFSYHGIDISPEMIRLAEHSFKAFHHASFNVSSRPGHIADYGVASGIFNVRLSKSEAEWSNYMQLTLDLLHETSRDGFSFNCLTAYSNAERMRDYLYYADPCKLFDLCKRRYARDVALLHDYGLYEFTILVRKSR